MPPQQTNLTAGNGRDAAGLRLERAIALEKGATGEALATAAPDASVAALRDGFSEKQAAGPPGVSTPDAGRLLQRYWRAFLEWRQRGKLRVSLHNMSNRELMDIGLTASDIDYMVAGRALERLKDGSTYLWPSRGLM